MNPINNCPVCNNSSSENDYQDCDICICCGTQFGYHDSRRTHKELRDIWIEKGMKWWSSREDIPENWNPLDQLKVFNK